MLDAVIAAVRAVAQQEIMPRYLRVARQRKADGSLFTEADLAAQEALMRELWKIYPGTVVGEEMPEQQQVEQWLHSGEKLTVFLGQIVVREAVNAQRQQQCHRAFQQLEPDDEIQRRRASGLFANH